MSTRPVANYLKLDPLVGHTLKRWSVDRDSEHEFDAKEHHLWLNNPQTLYGVESATLAPGYGDPALQNIKTEITYEQT
jgi:hypothetical protein